MKFLALSGVLPVAPGVAFHHCRSDTFLMISQKVYEIMMGLCHFYSLLDKFHETLRLTAALPSQSWVSKEDQQPISRQTFAWLLDSGNFNQTSINQESTSAIGKTFFTINNEVC